MCNAISDAVEIQSFQETLAKRLNPAEAGQVPDHGVWSEGGFRLQGGWLRLSGSSVSEFHQETKMGSRALCCGWSLKPPCGCSVQSLYQSRAWGLDLGAEESIRKLSLQFWSWVVLAEP